MLKRLVIAILVILVLVMLPGAGAVQAADEITILDSSAEVNFPAQLKFSLSAESDYQINDIRLRYTVERTSFAEIYSEAYVTFTPGNSVSVEWELNLITIGGLPPGSIIDYWWLVKDTGGNILETEPVQVRFDDNRYTWQSLSEGKVTLYWYEGDDDFAAELMASTQEVLDRLDDNTGANLAEEARIYVYADSRAVRGAMINPQEWTGGAAFTRYSIIAIGIAPNNMEWGKRAIAHELTHLVVHQVTLNPYNEVPTWFDEGMAMYSEGNPESWYSDYVVSAIDEDELLSVRSLASPFSADSDEARLSYAQSYNIVKYLIQEYGRTKMLKLLNAFAEGNTYDGALERVYGFDMDGLDAEWREHIGTYGVETVSLEESMPAHIVGLLAGLSTGLVAGLAFLFEDWAWKRGW